MQGRLFGLMAIGKKESSQMDHKIGGCVGYVRRVTHDEIADAVG